MTYCYVAESAHIKDTDVAIRVRIRAHHRVRKCIRQNGICPHTNKFDEHYIKLDQFWQRVCKMRYFYGNNLVNQGFNFPDANKQLAIWIAGNLKNVEADMASHDICVIWKP